MSAPALANRLARESAVDEWRGKCAPEALAAIDALRDMARAAGPALVESIKWNAPSFALDGEDRITLGVERKGGVRAVLHRGAAKAEGDFSSLDTDGLAAWPSPDRGVLTFADEAAVECHRHEITALFGRWLGAAG